MYKAVIHVDFDKLIDFPLINKRYIDNDKQNGAVKEFEFWTEEKYLAFRKGLRTLLEDKEKNYNLLEHFNEILYLVAYSYENTFGSYDYNLEEYLCEMDKVEVAKILLAYKEFVDYKEERFSKDLQVKRPFSISIKFPGFDTETKNKFLAESIIASFYKSIEEGNCLYFNVYPSLFTETINGETSLSLEKIRAIANSKPKRPMWRLGKQSLVYFSTEIQTYLNKQTHLKTSQGTKLEKNQALFLYEILVLLELLNDKKISTLPEDYMHSIFSKYAK